MADVPAWWRGLIPPTEHEGYRPVYTGFVGSLGPDQVPAADPNGLVPLHFFRAHAVGLDVSLTRVHLLARWSEFDGCRFHQRVRPVLNDQGVAAQGGFGAGPSIYRGCSFERVRFKALGGFTLGQGRFEDCTFVDCRWEGHFAHDADLVACRFIGRMNGCVWFGAGRDRDGRPRRNVIEGNDFTRAILTDNVGWRASFPFGSQAFPPGYLPREPLLPGRGSG